MCDIGMKEAIEKLVKAIEGNSIKAKPPTLEFGTVSPWAWKPADNLIAKDISMQEEMKAAAKLALKDNGLVNKIEFYDVPNPEKVAEINKGVVNIDSKGKVNIDNKGIKVKSKHGNILFDCDGLSFDFGVALENIKKGVKVCRKGWNGKGMYVMLEKGGDYEFSEINPFFVIKNTSNSFNTWVPSVSDLLATDWTIYIGE